MKIFAYIYNFFLSLRYKINIRGLEKLDKTKNYLILPNHPALVDPQILVSIFGKQILVSPLISETYFNIPVVKYLFSALNAVSVPDLQRGSNSGMKQIEETIGIVKNSLKNGGNILIYPAGQLYNQNKEVIKGKKMSFEITRDLGENTEILLVKTSGLWGSMRSKAYDGKTPNFFKTFLKSIFYIFANLIFFSPRRKVNIEVVNFTEILKNINNVNEFNETLENFYNKKEEELIYKKHFFYFDDVKGKTLPEELEKLNSQENNLGKEELLKEIPEINKIKIFKQIAKIKEISEEKIRAENNLISDLYFDSLDLSEIKVFIQSEFKNADNPEILSLKSVSDLILMSDGKSGNIESFKKCDWNIGNIREEKLANILEKNLESNGKIGEKTILNLWKKVFSKNKNESFVFDNIFGLQTKKDFVIKSYLISDYMKKENGKNIGIMFPALASANIILISTYLAGKIPVMLNWTFSKDAFSHSINFSDVEKILTSKTFYEKIKNPATEEFRDKYIFLEDLLKDISLFTKLKALLNSFIFKIPLQKEDETAVILFTSGSESLPKAVPLTHKNIISDIFGSLKNFPITTKDILIGFLPPFHSFGFSINAIMPLITGMKVAYTPDPNDGKVVANFINHCKITSVTATPKFLSLILKSGNKEILKSLKYAVVGAEKCPDSVFEEFQKKCENAIILEGYGITECSPVISLNPPEKPKKGSVGKSIFGGEIKILDLNTGENLSFGKEGMIYFSGENIFPGYLDNKLESPFQNIGLKHFYKTGDLGYLDEDGYLFITGRLKRFVKIAGEMISLPFIENILHKKYSINGEETLAIEAKEKDGNVKIVLFSLEKLNLEEVMSYLRNSGISNLVKIDEIIQISELPMLGSGKIDYKILKEKIEI